MKDKTHGVRFIGAVVLTAVLTMMLMTFAGYNGVLARQFKQDAPHINEAIVPAHETEISGAETKPPHETRTRTPKPEETKTQEPGQTGEPHETEHLHPTHTPEPMHGGHEGHETETSHP
jgi:hypothetical protein